MERTYFGSGVGAVTGFTLADFATDWSKISGTKRPSVVGLYGFCICGAIFQFRAVAARKQGKIRAFRTEKCSFGFSNLLGAVKGVN
jgi:hypothetical protein